jgi:hypothetical protein
MIATCSLVPSIIKMALQPQSLRGVWPAQATAVEWAKGVAKKPMQTYHLDLSLIRSLTDKA